MGGVLVDRPRCDAARRSPPKQRSFHGRRSSPPQAPIHSSDSARVIRSPIAGRAPRPRPPPPCVRFAAASAPKLDDAEHQLSRPRLGAEPASPRAPLGGAPPPSQPSLSRSAESRCGPGASRLAPVADRGRDVEGPSCPATCRLERPPAASLAAQRSLNIWPDRTISRKQKPLLGVEGHLSKRPARLPSCSTLRSNRGEEDARGRPRRAPGPPTEERKPAGLYGRRQRLTALVPAWRSPLASSRASHVARGGELRRPLGHRPLEIARASAVSPPSIMSWNHRPRDRPGRGVAPPRAPPPPRRPNPSNSPLTSSIRHGVSPACCPSTSCPL